jgi:hypothetical protein
MPHPYFFDDSEERVVRPIFRLRMNQSTHFWNRKQVLAVLEFAQRSLIVA